ncbi:hypothetical protein PI124_g20297 [Phytophthora idaei]|nr:hypothetical protein PI125_g7747 [Phytophthora idaei]KAG3136824.1 hypothetical protein PI126_g17646 [Phytophthora idaei]KAG3234647.1 hypothetical protein PI124_g20297 [Phytophthora idaei]
MLERGDNQTVKGEPEEYEKELKKKRLFPLDENEVLLRVERNAEEQAKPALADMRAVLGVPVEVLERT